MIIIGITRICRRWTIRPYVPVILVLANPGLFISAIHPMSDTLAVGFIILALSFYQESILGICDLLFIIIIDKRDIFDNHLITWFIYRALSNRSAQRLFYLFSCLLTLDPMADQYLPAFGHLPLGGPDQFNIIPMRGRSILYRETVVIRIVTKYLF